MNDDQRQELERLKAQLKAAKTRGAELWSEYEAKPSHELWRQISANNLFEVSTAAISLALYVLDNDL